MANRYPEGKWRPLGPQTQPKMKRHDIICLHTIVGSLGSAHNYFLQRGYGGTESHFGVGYDGETYQWQDLDHTADANGNGNYRCISIETADMGTGFPNWRGSDVPPWTKAQIDRLAHLVAWLADQYDIPLELVPNSKPGHRGIGYHRQGADPYRVDGGELWSSAYGKVCPGDNRIAQIPTIIAKARQISNVQPKPPEPKTGGIVIPIALPRTRAPGNWELPSDKWPWTEEIIGLGYVGGWRGKCVVRISFGHPGGRIFRAHFDTPANGRATVVNWPGIDAWPGHWFDPTYKAGHQIFATPPNGPTSLMITYAAPGGASLNLEWER